MPAPTESDCLIIYQGEDWDGLKDTDFIIVEKFPVEYVNYDTDAGYADRWYRYVIQHKEGGPFYEFSYTYCSWDGGDMDGPFEVEKREVTKSEWVKID